MNKKNILIIISKLFFCILYSNLYSNDKHENLLNLLESNYPAEIFFKQISKDSFSEGWMIIEGSGKARIEFAPPNNILIVADGEWIMFHDPEIERTTYLPLNSGLLQALLDPISFKKRKDFLVKETIEKNKIIFTIEFNLDDKKQKVLIYFNQKNLSLLGWKIKENANEEINVKITDLKKISNKKVSRKNFFNFSEKVKETGVIYYGPYKRKINRIENNGKLN